MIKNKYLSAGQALLLLENDGTFNFYFFNPLASILKLATFPTSLAPAFAELELHFLP